MGNLKGINFYYLYCFLLLSFSGFFFLDKLQIISLHITSFPYLLLALHDVFMQSRPFDHL